jgi:hypothetical protein
MRLLCPNYPSEVHFKSGPVGFPLESVISLPLTSMMIDKSHLLLIKAQMSKPKCQPDVKCLNVRSFFVIGILGLI